MSAPEESPRMPPTHRWIHAVLLLMLTGGAPGCGNAMKGRWRSITVPGACTVLMKPSGVEFSYDAAGRLLSARSVGPEERPIEEGDWERFHYDAQGRLSEVHSGSQYTEAYVHFTGEDCYQLATVRELHHIRLFYDAQGRLERVEPKVDSFHRDFGQETCHARHAGTGTWTPIPSGYSRLSGTQRETYAYDEAGRPVAVNRNTVWSYEGDRLVAIQHPGELRTLLTHDALGRVAGARRESCPQGGGACKPRSESRYSHDEAGRLVEEVREAKGSTGFNLREHFRWQHAPPAFVRTHERTYGDPSAPALGPGRTELIYEKGQLAEVRVKGYEGLQFSYQGACENARVTAERTFAPDVLGSLKAAPCFTSPLRYYSTCVGGW